MADKALLIGINRYPGCPLSGCVNDVTDMAHFLVDAYGFKSSSITLLTDERATTKAILTGLAALVQGVQSGDRILFHYSGHGAQVAARKDEHVHGMDDVICPVDFDWSEPHLIRDLQFHEIFSALPEGVKFNWVADCCHSGTLDRDLAPPTKGKKASSTKKPKILGERFMPAPVDVAWDHRVARDLGHASRNIHRTSIEKALPIGFISGCKDRQTSADANFGGRANGALTYFLLQALKKQKDQPLTAVVDGVRAALKKSGYSQVPQIDGTRVNTPFLG
jgi:uncharacterized caspase-like protein